jgi:ribosomal-protein-alanine N-acetyltransferase
VVTLAYPRPELADGRVCLRRWRLSDLDCIEEAATDPRIPEGTSVPANFTLEEATAFVRRQWSRIHDGVGVSLAVADAGTDRAVGLAILSLRPQPGVGGLGYWVIPSARGAGYATTAARLICDWGLSTLGLDRVEAWVEPDNLASQGVLRSAGFEHEGRLRNFLRSRGEPRDALVFSRIRVTPTSRSQPISQNPVVPLVQPQPRPAD